MREIHEELWLSSSIFLQIAMEVFMSKDGKMDFVKGILFGGLIGAAIGILYAPKSSKETREQIAKKSDELLTKARDEYEKNLEKSKKAYESMMAGMKEIQAETRKKADEFHDKVEKWTGLGKDSLEDGKTRIKKAVEAGIEAFKEEKEKQKI